jgi:hypothetical protein
MGRCELPGLAKQRLAKTNAAAHTEFAVAAGQTGCGIVAAMPERR